LKVISPKIYLPLSEYKNRQEKIKEKLKERDLNALLLLNNRFVTYFTGLDCIPTERPIGIILPLEGELSFVTTKLEELHINESLPWVNNLYVYLDYPGDPHCYQTIVKMIKDYGLEKKKIGCDGLTPAFLYSGAKTYLENSLPAARFVNMTIPIVKMMDIKTEAEKEMVRESARWGCNTHRILQNLIEPGKTPYEISVEASLKGTKIMLQFYGKGYDPYVSVGTPVGRGPTWASFNAGPATAFPHGGKAREYSKYHRKIEKGDNIVTAAEADIGGYYCELERTMFVGEPSEKQKKYFNIMLKAQNAALEMFKPGKMTRDVDIAARRVFKENKVWEYVLHHSGHGRGYRPHEPPFCDIGDKTVLRPGMQFSCEPGIYIPEIGGFRHSDDVFVTKDEPEINSYYPRDLESMIIRYKK
jgi:Xaa-Pro aminopeptidase